MKRPILASLAIILGVALCWAAPPVDKLPSLLTTPAEARITSVIVGGSPPSSGPAPGTLLLGTNNLTTSADDVNVNANTAYSMCAVGQATATVTTAYFYDNIGAETDPVHVCIWNSSGTLLGCSGNITMTGSVGWRSVAWSGPSITASTNYIIGAISGTSTGFWTKYDSTSPTMIGIEGVAMTFGSEGNLSSPSCNQTYGSWAIYVTN